MPGLWPRGTAIYKWDHNRSGYFGNRRISGPDRNNRGSVSAQGQRQQYSVNSGQNGSQSHYQQRHTEREYRYRFPDQQRLHDQYT